MCNSSVIVLNIKRLFISSSSSRRKSILFLVLIACYIIRILLDNRIFFFLFSAAIISSIFQRKNDDAQQYNQTEFNITYSSLELKIEKRYNTEKNIFQKTYAFFLFQSIFF